MAASRSSPLVTVLAAGCVIAGLALLARQYGWLPGTGSPSTARGPMPADADALIPFDTSITAGTLPNGLRYFVRENRQPRGRAELRLVVNAGSLVEDDDQRGLAHVVEHLAFNGTANFPRQAIGAFLESMGMRFGPSINAFTGFDETIYALEVPTDNRAVLEKALHVLEDWAHRVTFDPVEVDEERRVIVEEWRLRRGAATRLQDAQFPILLKGSRYLDRMPIGTPESIQSFSPDRLRQFYRDWYRPDLMAVIAVGDFDAADVSRAIEARFSGIPAAAAPRPRPDFRVPEQSAVDFAMTTDREATGARVALLRREEPSEPRTVGDYRRELVDRLTLGMLANRLTDVSQIAGGPFAGATAGRDRIVRGLGLVSLAAVAGEPGIVPTLRALAIERERVRRHGFTDVELNRQREFYLSALQRAIAERERQPSQALAAEYIRHFTVREPAPGLQWEYSTTARLLPDVTVGDTNEAAARLLADTNRIVSITAPERMNVYVPSRSELEAVLASARSARLDPWVTRTNTQPLLDRVLTPGTVTRATRVESVDISDWTLSNGVRVILKPTDFLEDQIVFAAISPGGLSLADEHALIPAATSTQVVGSMGFGRFGSGDLRRVLAGKSVSVQPFVGPFEAGLSGGSSRRDLETLFELIHLTLLAPRRDPAIFEALQSQMRHALAGQATTPEFAFGDALSRALSGDHPRARPLVEADVKLMDMDKSLAFYRGRFGDASGFTFVFAGSFKADLLRPFVEKYLASLPATGRAEAWRDTGIRPPRGVVTRAVARGLEPKSRTAIVFTGLVDFDRQTTVTLAALAEVLQLRLREAIREELGGTYNVGVSAGVSRVPVGQYSITIDFTADPARVDALAARVFQDIARFVAGGPSPRHVEDVKSALLRDFESSSRQNAFVVRQLADRAQTGEPLESVWELPAAYRALTPALIQAAARRHLDPAHHVRVTLRPEK